MLYYIYYCYITGVTIYKLYEYWELAKVAYTTVNYTCTTINGVYHWVKKPKNILEMESITSEWDMCDVNTKNVKENIKENVIEIQVEK